MITQFLSKNAIKIALLAFAITCLFTSCTKLEGTGGLATIKGKVVNYKIDGTGDVVDTSYATGARVYISYGDHEWVDDDTRTSYTGEYAFQWLQRGDYKVWVIGGCAFCPDSQQMDIAKVTITDKRETVTVRNLIHFND